MELEAIAGAWEENQEFLKQCLGQSPTNRYGARWVLMPQVPAPKFNHISCIRVQPHEVPELLAEGRAFFKRHGIGGSCFLVTPATRPNDLGARLFRLGFTTEVNPVMLWDGTAIPWPQSIFVERADESQRERIFNLLRRVFFPNSGPQTLAMAREGVDTSFRLGALNYIAYVGGRPAGMGMLFVRGAMGGIYNMCTLPEYRGRGVATAVLAASVADAQRLGCRWVGLTPTTMGRPLYERLGFREIYQEQYFAERFENW